VQTAPARALPHGPPWPRHDRSQGEPDDDYLVPAEPAIGAVTSAQTNRKRHGWYAIDRNIRNQMILWGILGAVFGGVIGAVIGGMFGNAIRPNPYDAYGYYAPPGPYDDVLRSISDVLPWMGGLGFGVVLTVLGVLGPWLLRRRRSSYVGTEGLQEYVKYHLVGPKLRTVRFADCMQLQVARTRHFYNGAYTGTTYSYVWWTFAAQKAFEIAGQYNDTQTLLPSEPVQFAFAAEREWTLFKIAQVDRQIAQTGMARFNVGKDYVGIGKGMIEIGWQGQVMRLPRPDIQSLTLDRGFLVIKRTGAKEGWFSSEGVFRFPVSGMADFQVFMIVLEEQTGFKFR
jgi:hypothetical protein